MLYFLSEDRRFLFFFQDTSSGAEPAISHSSTATDPLTASVDSNSFLNDGGSKGNIQFGYMCFCTDLGLLLPKTRHTFHCYFNATAFTPALVENLTGVVSTVSQQDIVYLESGDTVLQTDSVSATSGQLTVIQEPGAVEFGRSFDGALQASGAALLPNRCGFQPLYKDGWLCRGVWLTKSYCEVKDCI